MILLGFDISELSWSAFNRKSMFDPHWYLRSERLVVYTVAMMLGTAAQGAAVYPLFKYESLRNNIQAFTNHTARVQNGDIVSAALMSVAIPTVGLLLLTIEYFVLLFWPNRTYPGWYNSLKKWSLTAVTFAMTATVIYSTVVVSFHSASITGVDAATALQLTEFFFRPPLKYNTWPQNIVWLVFLWLTVVFSLISVVLLHMAVYHNEKYGIKPKNKYSEETLVGAKEVTV